MAEITKKLVTFEKRASLISLAASTAATGLAELLANITSLDDDVKARQSARANLSTAVDFLDTLDDLEA